MQPGVPRGTRQLDVDALCTVDIPPPPPSPVHYFLMFALFLISAKGKEPVPEGPIGIATASDGTDTDRSAQRSKEPVPSSALVRPSMCKLIIAPWNHSLFFNLRYNKGSQSSQFTFKFNLILCMIFVRF